MKTWKRTFGTTMAVLGVLIAISCVLPTAAAADGTTSGNDKGLIAIAAALALGMAAVAAAYAQANIGAAAVGVFAEDEKKLGKLILLIVLPETILVFGFIIAYMLYGLI